jgi:hypothetical protein
MIATIFEKKSPWETSQANEWQVDARFYDGNAPGIRINDIHGRPDQAYAILTLCRAYYTSQNGEQTSKKRAAQWTAQAFPQWSTLIENALKWREDWRNNQVDAEETVPETKQFVHFILDHITD